MFVEIKGSKQCDFMANEPLPTLREERGVREREGTGHTGEGLNGRLSGFKCLIAPN